MSQINSTDEQTPDPSTSGYTNSSNNRETQGYVELGETAFGAETRPWHTNLVRNPLQSNLYDPHNLGDSPYRETLANSDPTLGGYGEPDTRSLNGSASNLGDSAELEL